MNHNAMRQHLAVLKDALLVFEEYERRNRPVRPRLLYRVSPDISGSWGTKGPLRATGHALERDGPNAEESP